MTGTTYYSYKNTKYLIYLRLYSPRNGSLDNNILINSFYFANNIALFFLQ